MKREDAIVDEVIRKINKQPSGKNWLGLMYLFFFLLYANKHFSPKQCAVCKMLPASYKVLDIYQ